MKILDKGEIKISQSGVATWPPSYLKWLFKFFRVANHAKPPNTLSPHSLGPTCLFLSLSFFFFFFFFKPLTSPLPSRFTVVPSSELNMRHMWRKASHRQPSAWSPGQKWRTVELLLAAEVHVSHCGFWPFLAPPSIFFRWDHLFWNEHSMA